MVCPNCQGNISDKRKNCERCGIDLSVYKRVMKASNQYYNHGLAKAKVRDLSGAIIALKNSLQLNKNHIDARNLLGLVYFEIGEVVKALSEWVISKHLKPEANDADRYISEVQSNPTRLDNLNQAIKRYNNALTYARQQSGDLAILQLKKVITLNPRFLRAYHLLALLYIKSSETEKAKKCLIRAGKIDVTNTTTLRYMMEVEPKLPSAKEAEDTSILNRPSQSSIMPISTYREDKPNIMAFVNLVLGVVIGIAVMAILVIPSIKKNQVVDNNKDHVDYSAGLATLEAKEATIVSLQDKNTELQTKVSDLQKELDSIEIPTVNHKLYDSLYDVSNLYMEELKKSKNNRDFMAVVDALRAIDATEYESEKAKEFLEGLKAELYPEIADKYYESGRAHYNGGRYEQALEDLKFSYELYQEDPNSIYFLARTYHRLTDYENAATYYTIITEDYKDSSRYNDSVRYLSQVTQ